MSGVQMSPGWNEPEVFDKPPAQPATPVSSHPIADAVRRELAAMETIHLALSGLTAAAQERVLRWVTDQPHFPTRGDVR